MKRWSGTKIYLLFLIKCVTEQTYQKTIKDKPQIYETPNQENEQKTNNFVSMKLEIKSARMELA